jgi:hypothetical protein
MHRRDNIAAALHVVRQEQTMRTGTAIALAVLLVVIVLAAGIQLVLVR